MADIISSRLTLRPMAPAFLTASLERDRFAAAACLGASVPDDWPARPELLSLRLEQLRAEPALQPWLLRAMCTRDGHEMVGHIGCHTAPGPAYLEAWVPGAVEIGFTVFAPFRRQGLAEEAVRALMGWAASRHAVKDFVMTVAPDNLASQRLAAKLGFVRIGSHIDAQDGPEDVLTWGGASGQ